MLVSQLDKMLRSFYEPKPQYKREELCAAIDELLNSLSKERGPDWDLDAGPRLALTAARFASAEVFLKVVCRLEVNVNHEHGEGERYADSYRAHPMEYFRVLCAGGLPRPGSSDEWALAGEKGEKQSGDLAQFLADRQNVHTRKTQDQMQRLRDEALDINYKFDSRGRLIHPRQWKMKIGSCQDLVLADVVTQEDYLEYTEVFGSCRDDSESACPSLQSREITSIQGLSGLHPKLDEKVSDAVDKDISMWLGEHFPGQFAPGRGERWSHSARCHGDGESCPLDVLLDRIPASTRGVMRSKLCQREVACARGEIMHCILKLDPDAWGAEFYKDLCQNDDGKEGIHAFLAAFVTPQRLEKIKRGSGCFDALEHADSGLVRRSLYESLDRILEDGQCHSSFFLCLKHLLLAFFTRSSNANGIQYDFAEEVAEPLIEMLLHTMNEYGFGLFSCLDGTRKMIVQVLEGRVLSESEVLPSVWLQRLQEAREKLKKKAAKKALDSTPGDWPRYRDSILEYSEKQDLGNLRAEAVRLFARSCVYTRKREMDALLPQIREKRKMLQDIFDRLMLGDDMVIAENLLRGLFFRCLVGRSGAVLGSTLASTIGAQQDLAIVADVFASALWADVDFWKESGFQM